LPEGHEGTASLASPRRAGRVRQAVAAASPQSLTI